MKLIFIHGWAVDSSLWDGICALLPDFKCEFIDRGYFGKPTTTNNNEPSILVGHSLGFVHGLQMRSNWRGWIAINSFPRFVKTDNLLGCTSAVELREIGVRLKKNTERTVRDFHSFILTTTPQGTIDAEALQAGLDELRDKDVGTMAAEISPGLVIASKNDPLVPIATSEVLAKDKDIVWHETSGHILPQSDPAFCAKAIREFMERYDLIRP